MINCWNVLLVMVHLSCSRVRFNFNSHGITGNSGDYHIRVTKFWKICRGYKRFFKRTAFETSNYLKDDSLNIFVTVGVVISHTKGPKQYNIPVTTSDLGHSFRALLESSDGADVSFKANRKTFRAHKLVLATHSPTSKAQLYGPMRDRRTEIKLRNLTNSCHSSVFLGSVFRTLYIANTLNGFKFIQQISYMHYSLVQTILIIKWTFISLHSGNID